MLLNFKYYPAENSDGYDVFGQIIDIETGEILAQAESKVVGRRDAALTLGMTEAAPQLKADGTEIGQLVAGLANRLSAPQTELQHTKSSCYVR